MSLRTHPGRYSNPTHMRMTEEVGGGHWREREEKLNGKKHQLGERRCPTQTRQAAVFCLQAHVVCVYDSWATVADDECSFYLPGNDTVIYRRMGR